jgi:hypothetical protein
MLMFGGSSTSRDASHTIPM